jgi:UDP-2,3-diacylglucosamine hydrolase
LALIKNKYYFASDFHLGLDLKDTSKERELKIVQWLKSISVDCHSLFLVGDIFDYWFEYKKTIPKGYTRLLGQLAEMNDNGVEIHYFVGNHDMWIKDYFTKEIGIKVYYEPKTFILTGKSFLIGHGDGLGPKDYRYKIIKKVLRNPIAQFGFSMLPSFIGLSLMRYFSSDSRHGQGEAPITNINKEWLVQYAEAQNKLRENDFYIFGHRHIPIDHTLTNEHSRYINLGDWLEFCTYVEYDGEELSLKTYNRDEFKNY